MTEVIVTSILYGFNQKNCFFEGLFWFKFNNLGLALGTNLLFYTSVGKGLKLKIRNFYGLIPTFVEVTREKLLEGAFNRVGVMMNNPPAIQFSCKFEFMLCKN